MTQEEAILTEDYLIAKGFEAFKENPDKATLERQLFVRQYMQSKYNRIKYLIDAQKNSSKERD